MTKAKGGRPSKLPKVNLDQVEALGQYGLTEEEVAHVLDVAPSTLSRWKKNPKFSEALKKGKDRADAKIVKSLFLKAFGYQQVVHHRPDAAHPQPWDEALQIPGDTTAMIFWLKNRQRDRWRDRHDMDLPPGVSEAILSMAALQRSLKDIEDGKS